MIRSVLLYLGIILPFLAHAQVFLQFNADSTEAEYQGERYAIESSRHNFEFYSWDKHGLADPNGKVLLPPNYSWIATLDYGIIKYRTDSICGLLDSGGMPIIEWRARDIREISESGIAVIAIDFSHYGVFTTDGDTILPPIYNSIELGSDSEPQRIFARKGKHFAVFDVTGKALSDFIYDEIKSYKNGRIWAKKGNRFGMMDPDGIERTAFKYNKVNSVDATFDFARLDTLIPGARYGTWTIVNSDGKELIPPSFIEIKAYRSGPYKVSTNGVYDHMGSITRDGVTIAPALSDDPEHNTYLAKGNWGIMDSSGKMIIEPQFERIKDQQDHFYIVKKNGRYGLYDITSKKLSVAPKFVDLEFFNSQYLIAHLKEASFLMNYDGSRVNDQVYDWMATFRFGKKALVKDFKGKYGVIDSTGKLVIPFLYDKIERTRRGLYLVNIGGDYHAFDFVGGKWGLIHHTGKVVLPIEHEKFSFHSFPELVEKNGLYGLIDSEGKYLIHPKFTFARTLHYYGTIVGNKGQYGFITKEGTLQFDVVYDSVSVLKTNYLAALKNKKWTVYRIKDRKPLAKNLKACEKLRYSGYIQFKKGDSSGIINDLGDEVLIPNCQEIDDVRWNRIIFKSNGYYGLTDLNGKVLLKPQYRSIKPDYSLRKFKLSMGQLSGLADTDGSIIIPAKYRRIDHLKDNLIAVEDSSRKHGLITLSGDIRVPIIYQQIRTVEDSFLLVTLDYKYGLIDLQGQTRVSHTYKKLRYLSTDRLIASTDSGTGIIDFEGNVLQPLVLDDIRPPYQNNEILIFKMDKKWGLMDLEFNVIVEPEFDYISPERDGTFKAKKDDQYQSFDYAVRPMKK